MWESRSIFVLEEAYSKKKKLFSELEEKKNGNFLSANSESVYYLVKKKKTYKAGV
jgi:hypothetical protein